jgi:cyclophilin family peptidyl-prolyl cis-trans isomerase/HEAT repeat protein
MGSMRRLTPFLLFAALSCTTATQPPASSEPVVQGITDDEEAIILRLEDRRELDRSVAAAWIAHPNVLHRARIALAIGRIAPHSFSDTNANSVRDPGEAPAGIDLLISAANDPEYAVRRNVAFALGEIGDEAGISTLLTLTRDAAHADVAAEAVEALSKMAAKVGVERYAPLAADERPGVRARALRFLFRFTSEQADAIAAAALSDLDPAIRREGAYSLSRRAYPAARQKLELLLTDPDTLTRSFVARALGVIGDAASFEPLIERTGDIHPWVRTNVARSLVQIADKNPTIIPGRNLSDDILRIFALAADADPGVRLSAIDVVALYAGRSERARAHIQALATGGGAAVDREAAASAIAKQAALFGEGAVDTLLQTDSPWVKVRVLDATAATPLGALLRQRLANDSSAMVRANVAVGIPSDRIDAELSLVRQMLADPDTVVRSAAVEKLAEAASLTVDERVRILTEAEAAATRDEMNDARVAAIAAMATLDFPGRQEFLRGRLQDRDPMVRRLAATTLVEKFGLPAPQYTPLAIERPLAEYEAIAAWARGRHTATLKTARGDIELALLTGEAPMTTWNFATLAKKGYFDGTTFMRVVPNFVVQSGDPRNDQSGGPGYSIRDEINLQRYTRGAVGMALSGPDTGGSQYFITHSPQPHLDGTYTIFARVTKGMSEVVDQIERGDRVQTILIDGAASKPAAANLEEVPLPVVLGPLTAAQLLSDVPEYNDRKVHYNFDRDVVSMLASAVRPSDRVEVFLGTWCTDSQREVPKFLRIVEELERNHGVSLPSRYVAVNRAKNEPSELIEGRDLKQVATFIVYRDEVELGRIVEKPEAVFEDQLLQILAR